MKVTYKEPGFRHSIDSILLFQMDTAKPFWSDTLFYFYPQLSREKLSVCSPEEQVQYMTDNLSEVYRQLKPELDEKAVKYNEYFMKYEHQINDALSDAFDLDARNLFNDLTGFICLNPICPRFLRERYFDVFHKNSEKGALGMSLHEIIHYFWFDVWNRLFHDSYDEYETPSLKWILSEMVVESIMADERLSSINPYFPREHGGCVYGYFQDMVISGQPVLDTLDQLYKGNRITDFMKKAYAFCQEHETDIRSHIAQAEQSF